MPQLLRLRMVSVGHIAARLDDLTLAFRDADGRAADSTLWLRNGGGKSSILNLFFAIMRPHRQEFLGGQSDAKQRSLDDYILGGDRSVTAAEWSLDALADSLGFDEGERLLTGVFYERREAGGELRRLFFATRVSRAHPCSTLEGLPLYQESGDGGRRRTTLAGFREAWLGLRDRAPHLGVSATDSQREWQEVLEGARIDPELFSYQVRMNRREGGVDELFRFASAEGFVDFLLEMALEPALAGDVGRNIAAWRSELVRRQELVQPERELVARMLDRLAGLRDVREARGRLRADLVRVRTEIGRQERLVAARREELVHEATIAEEEERKLAREAAAGREAAARSRARAAGLRRHAARLRLQVYQDEMRTTEEQMREQRRLAKIWAAAEPLRSALRFEGLAATNRRLLEERQREHAPLREALEAAARQLAGALAHVAGDLRQAAGVAHRGAGMARDQAREYRQQAAEERRKGSLAEARAGEMTRQLSAAETRAAKLAERGFLETGEGSETGLARWSEALRVREEAIARSRAELEGLDEALETLDRSIQAASAEHATRVARAEALTRRWQEATAEREAIEADSTLRAALELETIDADRLAPEAIDRLDRAAREEQRTVVRVRLEAVQDQHALDHLAEWGLLPASADVRQAVRLLRRYLGGQAWSGWEWLEANVRAEERAQLARRAPYLAEGVVVRADDLERAAAVLGQADLLPAGPLAIVAVGGVRGEGPAVEQVSGGWPELPAVVLGPGEAALYDREAGRVRNEELTARAEKVEELIRTAEDQHRELVRVQQAVRSFRDRYPVGWFAEAAERLAEARREEADQAGRLGELRRIRTAKYEERRGLAARREQLEREVRRAQAAVQELAAHVADYVKPADGCRRELAAAQQQARAAAAEAKQWDGLAAEAEESAEELAAHAQERGEAASRCEDELGRVSYVKGRVEPAQGPLDQLRTSYETRKASYEQRVGADQLAALASQAEAHAREQRRRLERQLSEDVTEEVVGRYLADLANPDEVDTLREQADAEARSLHARLARYSQLVQSEQEAIERADQRCTELGVGQELERAPGTPQLADGEANQLEEAVRGAEAAAAESEAAATKTREHAGELRSRVERLERLAERLASVVEDYGDLFVHLPRPAGEGDPESSDQSVGKAVADKEGSGAGVSGAVLDENAVRQYAGQVTSDLRVMREQSGRLDQKRLELAAGVRAVASSATATTRQQAQWVNQIVAHPDPELEDNSLRLADQLALRQQTLDGQLVEIDKHRAALAEELLRVAKDGLNLLKRATSLSRLPETIAGVGGAQFLRISTDEPADSDEQRSRMAQLVDELARGDRELDGIRLAQTAVRRLARRVGVRVMHPDPALQRQTVSIPEMARFSGGEQLTGAIMLYCTLANVRGRARGQAKRPSSVLVLDNPIGRASRPQFLRLQREVARAMGVQLIYTTAVNDHEALSALPNVIRLRNERVDRNSGRRLVEHVVGSDGGNGHAGVLQAVRIGRREQAAGEMRVGREPERASTDERRSE